MVFSDRQAVDTRRGKRAGVSFGLLKRESQLGRGERREEKWEKPPSKKSTKESRV